MTDFANHTDVQLAVVATGSFNRIENDLKNLATGSHSTPINDAINEGRAACDELIYRLCKADFRDSLHDLVWELSEARKKGTEAKKEAANRLLQWLDDVNILKKE